MLLGQDRKYKLPVREIASQSFLVLKIAFSNETGCLENLRYSYTLVELQNQHFCGFSFITCHWTNYSKCYAFCLHFFLNQWSMYNDSSLHASKLLILINLSKVSVITGHQTYLTENNNIVVMVDPLHIVISLIIFMKGVRLTVKVYLDRYIRKIKGKYNRTNWKTFRWS